jgi:hypothetical protein
MKEPTGPSGGARERDLYWATSGATVESMTGSLAASTVEQLASTVTSDPQKLAAAAQLGGGLGGAWGGLAGLQTASNTIKSSGADEELQPHEEWGAPLANVAPAAQRQRAAPEVPAPTPDSPAPPGRSLGGGAIDQPEVTGTVTKEASRPSTTAADRVHAFELRAEEYGFSTPPQLPKIMAQPAEIAARALTELEAQLDDHVRRVGTPGRGQVEREQIEAARWGDEAGTPGEIRAVPPATTRPVPTRRSQVDAAYQLGVEGGERAAAADGIKLRVWNPPDAHILEYGRGFDDIGDHGSDVVVLEWKGEGSKVRGGGTPGAQMTSAWVGARIAKLKWQNHPIAEQLLDAAAEGRLKGGVYTTRTVDGEPVTTWKPVEFDPKVVRAAYEARMAKLVPGFTPPTAPTPSK